jgi:single-stranded DNA-specific DHH superfamily exonuclease
VGAELNIQRSITGQPWRWRRSAEPSIGMDALVNELLLARGVAREDLARHRDPKIRDFLPDPSCFQDMDKGARRLADAIRDGESIAIFGDYDVDGATSAALLVLLLRRLGADPVVYIPDRLMEGYGPSGKALCELKAKGASVAVCVDCGAQAEDQADAPVIIVMSSGWHQGVIGIVAGRLKERFGRPAIVIAECEDGTGKGSGRSISGVDLGAAVLAAKDSGLLTAGGGHAMAAGLTLPAGGLEPFCQFINARLAADVEAARGDRALLLDALLAPGGVAAALCDALDSAGPYGAGWPSPRVAAGPARLIKTGIVGDGHVRGLACGDDGKTFKWIAFRSASTELGQALLASSADARWWLAGTIKRDEWNGGNAAEMHLEDAALA